MTGFFGDGKAVLFAAPDNYTVLDKQTRQKNYKDVFLLEMPKKHICKIVILEKSSKKSVTVPEL